MAINWTNTFGDLGKLIARINSYDALGDTTLPADLLALTTQFGVRWLPPEGVAGQYEGMRSQVTDWRRQLAAYADRRVTDYELVLAELGLPPGTAPDDALAALARQMLADGKAVKACSCSATTPAGASGNRGDGRAWVTTVLDGYSAPLSGGRAGPRYDGLATELCVPAETMALECTADRVTDGLTEGSETFGWSGAPDLGDLDVRAEGSGQGPSVAVANEGANLLTGGGFEDWSASVPAGWTVEAGSAQVSESAAAGTFYRGSSSLAIAGGVSLVRLSQTLSAGLVQGRRRYFLGLAVLASAAAAGATVRAYLCEASGTPVRGAIEADGASLPLTWTQYGLWVGFPAPLPAAWKVVLEVTDLPAGRTVYLDGACLTPATYHGGVGLALTAGASPWQRNDRITFGVSNDGAGLFQSFARRHWRLQLPSVASGTRAPGGLLLLLNLMTWSVTESPLDSLVS